MGAGYRVTSVRRGEEGEFESLTVESPFDFAAMDISYVSGEEVREQVGRTGAGNETREADQARTGAAGGPGQVRRPLRHVPLPAGHGGDGYGEDDEDEFLDPGSLLLVLQRLAKLCHGIGVDPQAGSERACSPSC